MSSEHIIGGYLLHIYCNVCGQRGEFTARNKTYSILHARRAGWSVDVTHDSVRCPTHKGQRVLEQLRQEATK